MLDDLAGKRTGERIQILRERRGLSRPVLAGLVGMSASWLKGIEQGRRLPPRLPVLVKLAEALAAGDVAVLAGTDMDLGGAVSVPVESFARIPHDAVPAIRDAVRDPMLSAPGSPGDVDALVSRTADAWRLWHTSREHRTDVGRILPRLVTDARIAARSAGGAGRRTAQVVLAAAGRPGLSLVPAMAGRRRLIPSPPGLAGGTEWMPPLFLTVTEAAARLSRHRPAVLRMLHAGQLRSLRLGRSYRIPEAEVRRLTTGPPYDGQMLTVEECAGILRCTPTVVHGLLHHGHLTGERNGEHGSYRIPVTALQRFISAATR
jgi:excisionase family DNA binding protein